MTVAYEYKSKAAGGLDFLCRNSPCGYVNKWHRTWSGVGTYLGEVE